MLPHDKLFKRTSCHIVLQLDLHVILLRRSAIFTSIIIRLLF